MAVENLSSKIAQLSLNHFNTLPKSGKPTTQEWTVLSTIIQEHTNLDSESILSVVALGTGSKCIGATKMCPDGTILNDSHAEVICRRAFIRYLYNELDDSNSDVFTFHAEFKKFKLKDRIRFHFFTTHVPCGDAAIFHKHNYDDFGECIIKTPSKKARGCDNINEDEVPAKKQKTSVVAEDIFRTGAKCLPNDSKDSLEFGINYHVTGVVRTKPGRGDPTLSVSCSDKIAVWCHLGIQGALLSILLDKPVFLESFTIVGNTPFEINSAKRAFWERVTKTELLSTHFFEIHQVDQQFNFAKCEGKRPASASIIYSKNCKLEVSVDGKRQGITKTNMHSKSASLSISKVSLFQLFLKVLLKYNISISTKSLEELTYGEAKMFGSYSAQKKLLIKTGFTAWVHKNKNIINI